MTPTYPNGYWSWQCPDCADWGCGARDLMDVAYGARLHRLEAHDGLTFAEAAKAATLRGGDA